LGINESAVSARVLTPWTLRVSGQGWYCDRSERCRPAQLADVSAIDPWILIFGSTTVKRREKVDGPR